MKSYLATWWCEDVSGVRHSYGATTEEALAKARAKIIAQYDHQAAQGFTALSVDEIILSDLVYDTRTPFPAPQPS